MIPTARKAALAYAAITLLIVVGMLAGKAIAEASLPPPQGSELVAAVNDARERYRLPELPATDAATAAAQLRADELARAGHITHYTPTGELAIGPLLADACPGYELAGEILARNDRLQPHHAAVASWLRSPSHRDSLLGPAWTNLGAARAVDAAGITYLVVIFCQAGGQQ